MIIPEKELESGENKMDVIWNEIKSDYEKAIAALRCPKGVGVWRRNEETGRFYLWKA